MRVIGVDPGLTGALVAIERGEILDLADMPVMLKGKGGAKVQNEINAAALAELLRKWYSGFGGAPEAIRVVVETVNSRPTAGPPQPCPACKRDTKALGSSSVFSMGDSIGAIRGVIATLNLPIEWVPSATWKAHFNLRGGHDQKEAARAHAIRLFPAADLARKKDHGRAEAILIALWWLEKHP